MKRAAKGKSYRRSISSQFWKGLIYFFIAAVTLSCIIPFIHVVSKSLSTDAYVIANRVFLLPKGFTLDAYSKVFQDASIIRSLYITVFVTVTFTLLGMFLTCCAAYALSRPQFRGRRLLTFLCVFTLYFSGGIIPEYILISSLGMLDTLWSIILPLSFSAYNLIIMKNAMMASIPLSLEESARIDGGRTFPHPGPDFPPPVKTHYRDTISVLRRGPLERLPGRAFLHKAARGFTAPSA